MTINSLSFRHGVAAASTADMGGTFAAGSTPSKDTITGSAAALVVDGYTLLLNDRLLVKNQTAGSQNGIYTLTTLGESSSGIGPVATLGSVTPNSGYLAGTYTNVPLIGGTGSGALATVVVAGPGPIASTGALVGGSGYHNGSYNAVALTGGTGSEATANITVQSGRVVSATIVSPGAGYAVNDLLSATLTSTTTGPIATLGTLVGGSAYTAGTYTAVPLTGGTGTGAQATVVVASGAVTTVTITAAGTGYTVGDLLSASVSNLGGTGSGFSVPVATITSAAIGSGFTLAVSNVFGSVSNVTITTPGTGYTVGDSLTANSAFIGNDGGSGFSVPVATVTPTNWVLTRAPDAVSGFEGMAVFVTNGSVGANTAWVQNTSPVVVNTTALTFVKFIG